MRKSSLQIPVYQPYAHITPDLSDNTARISEIRSSLQAVCFCRCNPVFWIRSILEIHKTILTYYLIEPPCGISDTVCKDITTRILRTACDNTYCISFWRSVIVWIAAFRSSHSAFEQIHHPYSFCLHFEITNYFVL